MRSKFSLPFLLVVTAIFGYTALTLQRIPPTLHLDPRLSREWVEKMTGLSFPKEKTSLLAGFDFGLKLPLQPPSLYIGFSPPAPDMTALSLKQSYFQVATAFHSLEAPFDQEMNILNPLKQARVLTADSTLYARFRSDLPNLEFISDVGSLVNELSQNENVYALLNMTQVSTMIRTITGPLPLSIWMGWKKTSFPGADQLGINKELESTIKILTSKVEIETKPFVSTIVAVGDIMLGRNIGKIMAKDLKKTGKTSYPFRGTENFLNNADITIGNLECAISDKGTPMPGKDYTFRADPLSINQLLLAGFDIVTMGNNHSKDFGPEALIDTLNRLNKAGILTIGAGKNRSDARSFKVLSTKDGTRIGFLGYTLILPRNFLADKKNPGVAWGKEKGLAEDIKAARAACDILMVQYHWGTEYTVKPTKEQRDLAHKTLDWGADIIISHHPHWIQEVEFYKGKFIAYSLGNFIFDMNHRPKVTEGLVVTCELRDKKISQVRLDPVSIKRGQPELMPWDETTEKRHRKIIMREIFEESHFPGNNFFK